MVRLIDKLEISFNRFTAFLIGLVAVSIGLFAVLIPLNLLLVKLQWGALWWLNESLEYILYAGVFLGAPWVLQQGAHVRVDVVNTFLSKKASVKLERVVDFAGFILCLTLGIYGARATVMEWQDGTMPDKTVTIANWIILTVFVFSFVLLAIEFLFRLRRAKAIVNSETEHPAKTGF